MNSEAPPFDNTRGVIVFFNVADVTGLRMGEPALFRSDGMALMEDLTEFLRVWFVESGRRSSERTWANAAYAVATWIDFLDAIGIDDWKDASRDDLIEYRESYLAAISPKTGQPYARGTVSGRMSTICALYAFAGRRGWYRGDILDDQSSPRRIFSAIDRDALAHTRSGTRLTSASNDLIPKRRRSRTAIRPFTIQELQDFCAELGPRASARGTDRRPARDRLIADIGWSTGLRLHEIAKLTKYQFLSLVPAPAEYASMEHQLIVAGKGNKPRSIAIPNWVVLDTLAYIDGERAGAAKAGRARKEPTQLILSGLSSRAPGEAISQRRFQQIVEKACIRAGLTHIVERVDHETRKVAALRKAKHCVHDLRHTYAVLTYWVEKRHGNPEPWKKIQAQLGHEHLATTTDIYLHFVEIFGQREGINLRAVLGLD